MNHPFRYPTTVDLGDRSSASFGPAGDESDAADLPSTLAGNLARDMRQRWRNGEQPLTEEFLTLHPELWQQPESAIDIIYEEIHLRQESGQGDVWTDVFRRFPQWHSQLQALRDCHQLLDSPRVAPKFPLVGESLGGFRLVAELGRGAQGRVFLATQPALANRPVVLKVTPPVGREHLLLARLQHTNIVPLYAARDDRARQIRLLCMPYFGGATLSSLLHALCDIPLHQRTGQHLVSKLDDLQATLPITVPKVGKPRQLLARATYVQAVCWIGACCAEALQYAHERGLLHLDLKPSNLLVAADGQPMLLDFHLAHEPIRPGSPSPEILGGTPAYMPPEQRAVAESLGEGRLLPATVDARADVYSLGALLYEALGGKVPFQPGISPPLGLINLQGSVGLSDIIGKCLAAAAADRYPDAAALAADLRRHMTDHPLRGVPNRSWSERWRKWRRRRPAALRFLSMLVLTVAATLVLAAGTWFHITDKIDQAERALSQGKKQYLDRRHYAEAIATLQHGLALMEHIPFRRDLILQLREQLGRAKDAQTSFQRERLGRELHSQVEQMRALFGVDLHPSAHLRSLVARCQQLWDKRKWIRDALGSDRAPTVAADLTELAILLADLRVRLATADEVVAARHEALHVLGEATDLFGPGVVLNHVRAQLLQALDLAESAPSQTAPRAPTTAWDHYALGRSFLRSGDLARSREELRKALDLQPHGCWPNYYYGLCAYRLKHYEDAALAFSVCIGATPDLAGLYYSRALALTALGRTDQAVGDYNRALQLDPTLAAAALNRGMLHFQKKRYAEATTDLQRSLQQGANPATVHYDLALVFLAHRQRAAALASLRRALEHAPQHPEARKLLEGLEKK